MRLVFKFSLALLSGLLLIFGVFSYQRVRRQMNVYETEMRKSHTTMASALAPVLSEIWKEDTPEKALRLIEATNEREPEVLIRWVWLDPDTPVQYRARLPLDRLELVRAGKDWQAVERLEDGEYLLTYKPLPTPDPRLGSLEFSESLVGQKAYARSMLIRTVWTVGAFVAMGGIVTLLLGFSLVARPMSILVAQARRVGAGDFSSRLDLWQRDEIGVLGAEMNAMCDQLEAAHGRANEESSARIAALEQLRHADRLATVGALSSEVAHELGTPLNVILGRAKMIAGGELSDNETRANAEVIATQAKRMTETIRALLDFARRGQGRQRAPQDIQEIAVRVARLIGPLAEHREVELVVEEGPSSAVRSVDVVQIEQALTNLVVNALDMSPTGSSVRIQVGRERLRPPPTLGGPEGVYAFLRVRDQGPGVPERLRERIFEAFFTTKQEGRGTGLGLSIADGIAREHEGWISVENHPEGGSVFSLYLPADDGAA